MYVSEQTFGLKSLILLLEAIFYYREFVRVNLDQQIIAMIFQK